MHFSSMQIMYGFLSKYVKKNDKILDVGSAMVNTGPYLAGLSYRGLLKQGVVEYTGLDIKPGENVDLVVKDPYKWTIIKDDAYDIVISGQAFEHIEFFWLVFQEMVRVLKKDGYMCIIAPKLHLTHKHPVDCWRFLPDGMRALAKYAEIKCINATALHIENWSKITKLPADCVGVFQK